MPARPILVLCEGPHDIAFLTRLLGATCGAVPLKATVATLPPPLGDFFTRRLAAREANEASLGGGGPVAPDVPPLLEAVWKTPADSRNWYFLNCGGDDKTKEINAFLKLVLALTQISEPVKKLAALGIVFVNDADDKGIAGRQKIITDRHSPILAPLVPDFSSLAANAALQSGNFGAGTCVFAKPGLDNGTLEDIVWSLWKPDHAARRDSAHELMKSLAIPGTKIGPGSTPSKILKAAFTTAGQTECPGYSLNVILRDTTALDTEAMKSSVACAAFAEVLLTV